MRDPRTPQELAIPAKPPQSQESERAVLGGILLSPRALTIISQHLAADDFFLQRHKLIYESMLTLGEASTEIDLRTLQAQLEAGQQFEAVGGMAYLAGLDIDLPDLGRMETYAGIVKSCSIKRQLIAKFSDLARDCAAGGEAAEILEQAGKLVGELGRGATRKGFRVLAECHAETLDGLEEMGDDGRSLGLPTGFLDWDRMTQGLVAGNLIIIAGRPGMGKTTLAVNVCQHLSRAKKIPVAFFSLEMTGRELSSRILSTETEIPFANLRTGRLSLGDWQILYDEVRASEGTPLWIDESSSPSLHEVQAKARQMRTDNGVELIVIDYLQLMNAGVKVGSREQEIALIARTLKELAKELDIPIIAISQLSRNPERRVGQHRPQLADLRESGAIEQDADMVAFVYRDEVYHPDEPANKGLAELIIAKHRNGETGTVELVFIGETVRFASLDQHHETQESFP